MFLEKEYTFKLIIIIIIRGYLWIIFIIIIKDGQ